MREVRLLIDFPSTSSSTCLTYSSYWSLILLCHLPWFVSIIGRGSNITKDTRFRTMRSQWPKPKQIYITKICKSICPTNIPTYTDLCYLVQVYVSSILLLLFFACLHWLFSIGRISILYSEDMSSRISSISTWLPDCRRSCGCFQSWWPLLI